MKHLNMHQLSYILYITRLIHSVHFHSIDSNLKLGEEDLKLGMMKIFSE